MHWKLQTFHDKTGNGGNILVLSQPGVGHDGSEDGGQVTESHKSVIDGGGQVIVPEQEVPEVQHQHRCGKSSVISAIFTHAGKKNVCILLTSHAIVGEALAELIDNDEEDAQRVTADHFILKV